MTQIIKRDGRIVPFDQNKIIDAVLAAFKEVDGEISDYALEKAGNIADYVADQAEKSDTPLDIEDIQDMVEKGLMSTKKKKIAKAYILYREERARERLRKTKLMQTISEKLTAANVQSENANIDEASFGGRMGEANTEMMKQYALDYCLSDMAKKNHLNNEIYIHDLGHYAIGDSNCLSIPFDDLLAKGFNTRQTDVRSAQSVGTAFQLVAVIFQLQSLQQFGGVSATHLDWTMMPYVQKSFKKHFQDAVKYLASQDQRDSYEYQLEKLSDTIPIDDLFYITAPNNLYQYALDMTTKEVYQGVEGLYHNLNTLQSRSGNQLPFTSINYGTCTRPEGRMVIKALLEVSIEGLGKLHKTPIFPCGIFQLGKGINRKPGDPNYDLFQLALESTSKRLYPNYCNIDWSNNAGYDPENPCTYMSTMGCRTANLWDINGLQQQKDGRGNICPVTIILPTLAAEAKKEIGLEVTKLTPIDKEKELIDKFIQILDTKIYEAKDMLLERFDWICSQTPESAKFMYENNTMAGYVPEEGIRSALKHGTLAIGQLGLAEALQILINCDHTKNKGLELAKKIEQLFKDRCATFKEKYQLNFGVYFTPAESLCYTAMTKFKNTYGEIPNVSDKDYFTNSTHVPVWRKIDPFKKIDIESQLTGYSSAGCITYVELSGSVKHNLGALETLVNYAMDKDIPYFAINVPNDMCMDCGYIDEIGDCCPICGGTNIRRLRRVTGYLTGDYKTAFNQGKQQEVEMRQDHTKVAIED